MKILVGILLSWVLGACSVSAVKPTEVVVLSAVADFTRGVTPKRSFYHDKHRQVLAINAGAMELRDRFIQASHELNETFVAGQYRMQLATVTEVDGESSYQVAVNGKLVAEVVNPVTTKEFEVVEHTIPLIVLRAGDVITVTANAVTNGKIPEGDGTAYSRGRWRSLSLIPVD